MFSKTLTCFTALALYTTAATAFAVPRSSPQGLWELRNDNTRGNTVTITVSKATDTIFGNDAEDYDYMLGGDDEALLKAIGTVETFAREWPTADADTALVLFENYSLGGFLGADQALDKHWMCNDVNCPTAFNIPACDDVEVECAEWIHPEL